jgi:hypothetical protein
MPQKLNAPSLEQVAPSTDKNITNVIFNQYT